MTDLNVKKEYLNLIYADCGKGSAGEKIKELVTVPGTQYLIFGVILGVFPLLAQLGILTSSFVFTMGNTMIYAIMAIGFCLLMGYSGLASLGTAGFVGIGAYIAYYFMQVYGADVFRHRQPLSQPKTHDYHNKLETVRAEKSA